MAELRDENSFLIQGWMINRLHLSGSKLLAYAIIYGVSQDGESMYCGGLEYLAKIIGLANRTILNILNELCDAEYIVKETLNFNGAIIDTYKANLVYVVRDDELLEQVAQNTAEKEKKKEKKEDKKESNIKKEEKKEKNKRKEISQISPQNNNMNVIIKVPLSYFGGKCQDEVSTRTELDLNTSNCALRPSYVRWLQLRDSIMLGSRFSTQPNLRPTKGSLDLKNGADVVTENEKPIRQITFINQPTETKISEETLARKKAKGELDRYKLKIFNDIWLVYPRQEERADAKKAFLKFMKGVKTTEAARERAFHVYLKAKAYNEKVINEETETRYIKKFRRWLEANFE